VSKSATKKSDAKPSKLVPRPDYSKPRRATFDGKQTQLMDPETAKREYAAMLKRLKGGQGKDPAEYRAEVLEG
jgi:hypothetical protein